MTQPEKDLESSLRQINANLTQGSANLRAFGDDLFRLARHTSSFADASKAAESFAKEGLTMEQMIARLRTNPPSESQ